MTLDALQAISYSSRFDEKLNIDALCERSERHQYYNTTIYVYNTMNVNDVNSLLARFIVDPYSESLSHVKIMERVNLNVVNEVLLPALI